MKQLLLLLCLVVSCTKPVPKEEPTPARKKAKPRPEVLASPDREANPYGSIFYADRQDDTYIENVGMVATYRLVGRKLPPEESFLLASENLGVPISPISWYEIDDEGQPGRQIDAGTLMLDNEMFLMFDYCKGESVDYWLISNDKSARLKTTIVPYPITQEAKDGATITIRRLTPDARLVLLEGKDFDPDEKIWVSSQSGTTRSSNVPIVCASGRFSMLFEPAVAEKSGGTAYIDIVRIRERLMAEYDWGCEATNPKKRMANTQRIKTDALIKLPTQLN